MSPYERQITDADELDAVDVSYVLGVPAQAAPSADETIERLPTASELLAAAGIEVGPGVSTKSLGYDPELGYDDTGTLYRAERDTAVQALLEDSGNHSALLLRRTHAAGTGNLRRTVATLVLGSLAAVGSVVAIAGSGSDGPSATELAQANGAATADVLAHDLGVGLGAWTPAGLPVTLTNTAGRPLSYNVTVEALDVEGRRITADVAFTGTLEPGRSTVATLFGTADALTQAELTGARFHVVEASAY